VTYKYASLAKHEICKKAAHSIQALCRAGHWYYAHLPYLTADVPLVGQI